MRLQLLRRVVPTPVVDAGILNNRQACAYAEPLLTRASPFVVALLESPDLLTRGARQWRDSLASAERMLGIPSAPYTNGG